MVEEEARGMWSGSWEKKRRGCWSGRNEMGRFIVVERKEWRGTLEIRSLSLGISAAFDALDHLRCVYLSLSHRWGSFFREQHTEAWRGVRSWMTFSLPFSLI